MILATLDRGVVPNLAIEQVGEIEALRVAVQRDTSEDSPLAMHLATSAFLEIENPGRVCPLILAGTDAELAIRSIKKHPELFPKISDALAAA